MPSSHATSLVTHCQRNEVRILADIVAGNSMGPVPIVSQTGMKKRKCFHLHASVVVLSICIYQRSRPAFLLGILAPQGAIMLVHLLPMKSRKKVGS